MVGQKDKWERIGAKKRAGVLAPLFSVYSKESVGIGDFADLCLLADWAARTGNSIIQLLPLNEVGSTFCPYDSVSSFALEPAYISFRLLPQSRRKNIRQKIENTRKIFPLGGAYADYRIKKAKMLLLWDIFLEEDAARLPGFDKFREENGYWLADFALFKVLKERQAEKPWYEWEDKYKKRDKESLEGFRRENEKEITFQMWVQWLASSQLAGAGEYCARKKLLLKGDLPVLVSRDSADVWQHPEFFKLEFAAGAPPDMYCAKGQRWGMPTYNWERIAEDGYRYLKEKLKFAGNFYDVLRIDHVVGLFRIWSIPFNEPPENQGLNGSFDPAEENKWREHGRNILSVMLDTTRMLLCAEDLGVIPKICPETLEEFGIPGNDVQRWVKDWKVRHDFLTPGDFRALSVAMLSTHDTTNWPAWWENEAGTVDEALFVRKCNGPLRIDFTYVKDRLFDMACSCHGRLRWQEAVDSVDKLAGVLARRKEDLADFIDLYENTYHEKEKLWRHLNIAGEMRQEADAQIMRAALKITLDSSAVFCINTVIDYLWPGGIFKGDPYQYRLNTPGTISPKNWSLVLPISLEELLNHKANRDIRKIIAASGREA